MGVYKVKVTINGEKIEGEYSMKGLLEELERVIKWQGKGKRK